MVDHPCWYRYADNVHYLCQDESEGQRILRQVQNLLRQSGLDLKGTGGVTDLRTDPANVLGFTVREQNGSLQFDVSEDAWHALKESLLQAHQAYDPGRTADLATFGWINAFGPGFENGELIVTRVCDTVVPYGFREINREQIARTVERAWRRWQGVVQHH